MKTQLRLAEQSNDYANELRAMADDILLELEKYSGQEIIKRLDWKEYHGFLKATSSTEWIRPFVEPFGFSPKQIQAEIVEVNTDLSHEIHCHMHSYAYIVCMGKKYHVFDPKAAKAYKQNGWHTVSEGDVLGIPPETPHGFTVEQGGTLTFLSLQTPPITSADHDDYVPVVV